MTRGTLIISALILSLIISTLFSLCVGPVDIPLRSVITLLGGDEYVDSSLSVILFDIRMPRVILAVLVGAALAQSGAVMQGLFQNPMADPYIVGVSSGAGLGATVAMGIGLDFWFYGLSGIGLLAFFGALGVTAVVYGISLRGGRMPVTVVLLSGIALGALASSITSYLMVAVRNDLFDTQRILFWLMGSLSSRRWEHVHMAWPQVLVGVLYMQWLTRDLNILT